MKTFDWLQQQKKQMWFININLLPILSDNNNNDMFVLIY